MPDSSDASALDRAATDLVLALRSSADFSLASLHELQRELARRAQRQALAADVTEELVDDVLVRFVQRVRRGNHIRAESAGAYLARSLSNAVVDIHRARSHRVAFDESTLMPAPLGDGDLARLLAANAARSDVMAGLAAAAGAGRYTVVRVVTQWLHLAETTGDAPSSRVVAFELDISHTTVNDALREFRRRYLPASAPDA